MMETAMIDRDREPMRAVDPQSPAQQRDDPTMRATPRQALWSWVAAIVIVFVLGVVFYGLNAADTAKTAANSAPVAGTATPATTGQGQNAAAPSQSSAQGTAQPTTAQKAPAAKDASKDDAQSKDAKPKDAK
jgi:hypothetical protein